MYIPYKSENPQINCLNVYIDYWDNKYILAFSLWNKQPWTFSCEIMQPYNYNVTLKITRRNKKLLAKYENNLKSLSNDDLIELYNSHDIEKIVNIIDK